MDLVVYRNDNGNGRVLYLLKLQAAVFPVNLTDVEIAITQVSSLRCRVKLHGAKRMQHVFFLIMKLLSLYRSLWILLVKLIAQLPADLKENRLMLI